MAICSANPVQHSTFSMLDDPIGKAVVLTEALCFEQSLPTIVRNACHRAYRDPKIHTQKTRWACLEHDLRLDGCQWCSLATLPIVAPLARAQGPERDDARLARWHLVQPLLESSPIYQRPHQVPLIRIRR